MAAQRRPWKRSGGKEGLDIPTHTTQNDAPRRTDHAECTHLVRSVRRSHTVHSVHCLRSHIAHHLPTKCTGTVHTLCTRAARTLCTHCTHCIHIAYAGKIFSCISPPPPVTEVGICGALRKYDGSSATTILVAISASFSLNDAVPPRTDPLLWPPDPLPHVCTLHLLHFVTLCPASTALCPFAGMCVHHVQCAHTGQLAAAG